MRGDSRRGFMKIALGSAALWGGGRASLLHQPAAAAPSPYLGGDRINEVMQMDIVDTQLHINRGGIEETLAEMDTLGIRSVLLDEFWGTFSQSHPTHIQPGYRLDNGAWRTAYPTAELASIAHPDRFSYLVRIDPLDPELESVMRVIGSSPHARAFRLQPAWTVEEAAAFAKGSHDRVLALAEDIGLPVCLFVPGYAELLRPYLKKFPRLTFVVDHCGMGFPGIPQGRDPVQAKLSLEPAYLATVCALAEFPNVVLKWSHAQNLLGGGAYPYEPLRPLLRQAIEGFGVERLMWAGDKSVHPNHTWRQLLFYLRDDPELSREEKEWLLGRTARKVLNWADLANRESAPDARE